MIKLKSIMSFGLLSLLPATLSLAGSATPTAPANVAGTPSPLSQSCDASRPGFCQTAPTSSSTEPFSVSLTAGYDSTFFCRGMDMGDNLWSGTITLDAKISDSLVWTATGRYLNVDETNFEETQLYTGLFYKIGALSIGPSFRWYHNINGGMMENSYDLGIQALVKVGPLNINGGYYYETESEGHYWELGVSAPIKITDRFSLVPSVEISYTDGWMMPMLTGWNTVSPRLSAPIMLTKQLTLTPWIGANLPLEALDMHQDNKLVGGVSLSVNF